MSYVLDTNVLSAIRVRGREPVVAAWVESVPLAELFVTAMTVAELERGVVMKERTDAVQGRVLRDWFEGHVLPAFEGRVLPFDLAAARVLATYRVPEHAPPDDAVTAAVAEANHLTVATRNLRHFELLGVACVDPWAAGAT